MRSDIGKSGVWICPTSPRTAYRPLAEQQYFWGFYQRDGHPIAARPGTSNHGWGLAVDIPTAAMQATVREHGHKYGWGIRGGQLASNAPSEAWHCTFHPGVYHGTAPEQKHVHPYKLMVDKERAARDVLVKQRRIAKRHGSRDKIDASHLEDAKAAKQALRRCALNIEAAAKKSGWQKNNRKARFDYINTLIGGRNG